MTVLRPLSRLSARTGLLSNFSRVSDSRSNRPFASVFVYLKNSEHSGCPENYKGKPFVNENFRLSLLGNSMSSLTSLTLKEYYGLPCSLGFRNFIHSGKPREAGTENNPRPIGYVRGISEEKQKDFLGGSQPLGKGFFEASQRLGKGFFEGSQHFGKGFFEGSLPHYEQNADIVHMKLLRNNTFITLTDSKGNRKPGQGLSASAGSLPDKGGKSSRFGAEAAAEHVGRKARDAGVKSVVVKVNGFTYFKKKRQAVMSFREGYTHSRGDQSPVVYIEDTTRRPHNGCRLPKKRRI